MGMDNTQAMNPDFLDFEQPIAELQAKIEELRYVGDAEINLSEEIAKLEEKANTLTRAIFAKLTPRQISQLARHPKRPYTLDLTICLPTLRNCMGIALMRMTKPLSVG